MSSPKEIPSTCISEDAVAPTHHSRFSHSSKVHEREVTASELDGGGSLKESATLELNSSSESKAAIPRWPHAWPTTRTARMSSLSLRESLGWTGCLGIFGGALGTLAVFGFLAFLWFGRGDEIESRDATKLWRLLALRNWMAQTITLCCLFLRFIISVQSTVCTSMIAALILENHFVRKSEVAYVSIARGVNDGPRKLLQTLLRSGSAKTLMRGEIWLLGLLLTLTLALQFSSTILLSDLHDFPIIGDVVSTGVNSLLTNPYDQSVLLNGHEMVGWTPVYSAFGEVQSASVVEPNQLGLSDSGLQQRGFLPLTGTENRTAVRFYEGNAMVLNSRTACMRPVMKANYSMLTTASGDNYGIATGVVDIDSSLRRATAGSESLPCDSDDCKTAAFSCYIPGSVDGRWKSAFCHITDVGGPNYGFDTYWDPSEAPWVRNSSIYLSLVTKMGTDEWTSLSEPKTVDSGVPFQEWNSYELASGAFVNASLCFSAFKMERKSVQMSTSGTLREPTVNWTLTSSHWDSSSLRNFLGVDGKNQTTDERGILNMTVLGLPDDGPASSPANENFFPDKDLYGNNCTRAVDTEIIFDEIFEDGLAAANVMNETFLGCGSCIGDGLSYHSEIAFLLEDIIASTSRAVSALQSMKTVVATTLYETYMKSFGQFEDVQMSTTKTVLIPGLCDTHGCGGFITVAVLLATHLVCVGVVTAIYATQVRHSRYGNVWHTVSQLVSQEMNSVFERGNDARDRDVRRTLRRQRIDHFVTLQTSESSGRIEVN
ncbi:hypothetical protein GGR54DRAFT_653248 [Hypoxylon sp. NC1633]|nr:hypothetical protein GGR54DRAFT_653248 [Hypoxylon sp. NC1633]